MLRERNEGTIALISTDNEDRFKYSFLSFGASIRAFPLLKKVVVVDGTFLTGKYKGTLLGATAQDANRQIFPLAVGIADTENNDSWECFFRQLLKVLPQQNDLVFVSDRHASIARAVALIYPTATHCFCNWHLKQNIKATFKKKYLSGWFQNAADCYTIGEFNTKFRHIQENCPKLTKYLEDAGFDKWARVHARSNRYNMMTSNNAETLNSVITGKKNYPVVALLKFVREKLTSWFQERREKALQNKDKITPEILKLISSLQENVGAYKVVKINEFAFEVTGEGAGVVVDLSRRSCTCRVFDVEQIPCVHALAAIKHIKANISDFVADFYTNEAWALTYQEAIYPVSCEDEEILPDAIKLIKCYPPVVKKRAGRPPSKRNLSASEFKRRIKYKK